MLSALLSAWEEVKAAEDQRAQQEAELFKNKTQTSTFQTEEVPPCCLTVVSIRPPYLVQLCPSTHSP